MKNLFLTLLLLLSVGTPALAQSTSTEISGVSVNCTDSSGRLVPIYWTDDAIRLGGGAYAQIVPGNGPSILLSPTYFRNINRLEALFTMFHECSHLALPIGVGLLSPSQERNADCHAVKEMQRRGLLPSWRAFNSAMQSISASLVHAPNKDRIKQAAECLVIPEIVGSNDICGVIDSGFTMGRIWAKKFVEETDQALKGYACKGLDNGSRLICTKHDLTEKMVKTTIQAAKSCFSDSFQFRTAHIFNVWENKSLGLIFGVTDFDNSYVLTFEFK